MGGRGGAGIQSLDSALYHLWEPSGTTVNRIFSDSMSLPVAGICCYGSICFWWENKHNFQKNDHL